MVYLDILSAFVAKCWFGYDFSHRAKIMNYRKSIFPRNQNREALQPTRPPAPVSRQTSWCPPMSRQNRRIRTRWTTPWWMPRDVMLATYQMAKKAKIDLNSDIR
jgi:hypothetical protein